MVLVYYFVERNEQQDELLKKFCSPLTTGSHHSQYFTRVNFAGHIFKDLPIIDFHAKIGKGQKNRCIFLHFFTHCSAGSVVINLSTCMNCRSASAELPVNRAELSPLNLKTSYAHDSAFLSETTSQKVYTISFVILIGYFPAYNQ